MSKKSKQTVPVTPATTQVKQLPSPVEAAPRQPFRCVGQPDVIAVLDARIHKLECIVAAVEREVAELNEMNRSLA